MLLKPTNVIRTLRGNQTHEKNRLENKKKNGGKMYFFNNLLFPLILLGLGWPCVMKFVGFDPFFHFFPTQQRLEIANILLPGNGKH